VTKRHVPVVLVLAPAFLIVAAVGYFLLVKPLQDDAGRLADQAAELQTQVDVAVAARNRQAGGAEETIRVADVFQLTKAMPDKTDMPGIVLALDSLASAAGVDFTSISPGAPVAKEGYAAVPINLAFDGSYYDLTDFLFRLRNLVIVRDGRLEAEGRLFSLDSLAMAEGKNGFPQIQAALIVNAYVHAPAPAPTAGTTAPTTTTTAPEGQALAGMP
jgi:Tfp pilus assembly protein PilO